MNLLVWCAKIQFEMNKLQKTSKNSQKHCFLVVFWRLFNSNQILAHQSNIFIFSIKFLISRHPRDEWVCLNNEDIIFGEVWSLLCHCETIRFIWKTKLLICRHPTNPFNWFSGRWSWLVFGSFLSVWRVKQKGQCQEMTNRFLLIWFSQKYLIGAYRTYK